MKLSLKLIKMVDSISKPTKVSVAITTFDRPHDLFKCLSSLAQQSLKSFDVTIVNGGEQEPVERIVMKFNFPITIVQQQRKGLVEARNLCWKESHGEIICMIDDDLTLSSHWLQEVLATFQSDEKIGGVSGPTIVNAQRGSNRDAFSIINKFQSGNILWRFLGKFYLNFIMEGRINEIGKIVNCGTFTLGSNHPESTTGDNLIDVDYLEACHMCVRRDLIEKVGGFDYCYTGTSEWSEPDLSFKISKLGYRLVFNPKAVTKHEISKQGVFVKRTYAYERSINFITFYFRHIKPNTLNKFVKFCSYLLFMNFYWFYKAIQSMNMSWLTGISGTFVGLGSNIFPVKEKKS